MLTNLNATLRFSAIKTLLRNHPSLLREITHPDGSFNAATDPDAMELPDPGDTLVRLSCDLWNGGGETDFDRVLNVLGEEDFDAFIAAMEVYGQLRGRIKSMHATNRQND
jgi:hypothetical protein